MFLYIINIKRKHRLEHCGEEIGLTSKPKYRPLLNYESVAGGVDHFHARYLGLSKTYIFFNKISAQYCMFSMC